MIGRIHGRAALIAAGAAFALCIAPAGADEMGDLKNKVEDLQKRLGALEGGTSVTVSGYVKADFYLDSDDDLGNSFTYGNPIKLDGEPVADGDSGAFGAHANQSRVRLGTSTDTSFGALNTVIEGDFWPGNLRLRQAYGELGPVLAGQAWSILGDSHTAASTVDFDGPVGVNAYRVPMLRLSLNLAEGFVGQMAVERGFGSNELPTFAAALSYSSGWGAINVAGGVGRVDAGTQHVSAHMFHAGAHLNVTDTTRIMATLNATSGLAYIYGTSAGTGMDASGRLKAQEAMGGMAGISHGWTDSISTGAYVGWMEDDPANGVTPPARNDKSRRTLHANIFWSPVSQASIGLEYVHGWRETYAAGKGEASRVQLGVQYSF